MPAGGNRTVILCRTAEAAQAALRLVQEWTASAGLTLHPDKTRIVDERIESFDFLGYRFEHGDHTPRPKSLDKLKDTIRAKTLRNSGQSMKFIVASVSPTLRGWFGCSACPVRREGAKAPYLSMDAILLNCDLPPDACERGQSCPR